MHYPPSRDPKTQTVTFPSGTVYCDAFRNLAHGTYYRVSFKPHELRFPNNNVARRRWAKVLERKRLLDPNMSNR